MPNQFGLPATGFLHIGGAHLTRPNPSQQIYVVGRCQSPVATQSPSSWACASPRGASRISAPLIEKPET